ncbi:MAG: protein kinase domain-containing protein [Chthoniobacterales bacterium]
MSATDGAPAQACASCGRLVETTGLEPFSKVTCPDCGAQLRVERTFENYEVVEPLGTGGMGSVFKARDNNLNRFVALKLLRKEFASDQGFTEKLQEEARITGSIKHPHVVEVYSVGSDGGQFYVVMELVDGGSLDDRIEDEKKLTEMRTLEVGLQVAQGLQAALQAGLIHRDIKPGNILFADAHTAKIVDFGLALLAEKNAEAQGEIWGTPYYIAPERLTGKPEDFRSDLYSLGATLFHAIAGRPTFESETLAAAELQQIKEHPPKLQQIAPQVSGETAAVIDRMLQPNPDDRQSSYKELIEDLQAARATLVAREEELRARWSRPVQILVLLAVLLSLGAAGYGIWIGLHHLPDWRSHVQLPWDKPARQAAETEEGAATASQVVDAVTEIPQAREELKAGHYAAAEALFRQVAAAQP